MSVKIRVLDRDNRTVSGVKVLVLWSSGGHSDRQSDSTGVADLNCSQGNASAISVDGHNTGAMFLKDGINTIYVDE